MDRSKRRIERVKGISTSPEHLQLIEQEKSLVAQLEQIQNRRKALAKQALKVQVFYVLHFVDSVAFLIPIGLYCAVRL